MTSSTANSLTSMLYLDVTGESLYAESTEDMQKTRKFSEAISKYLQNNPNADSVLASIPAQILESIEENDL